MSGDPALLLAEIDKIQRVLASIRQRLDSARRQELVQLGRNQLTAVFIAQLLEAFYTAVETLFLRISQHFENRLADERWHADLLDKMTLRVGGVREQVIREQTAALLNELLRFRHFKRYYLELDFDWAKLDYLLDVYDRVLPALDHDLGEFKSFLVRLAAP
jgi:hypothetical protein